MMFEFVSQNTFAYAQSQNIVAHLTVKSKSILLEYEKRYNIQIFHISDQVMKLSIFYEVKQWFHKSWV